MRRAPTYTHRALPGRTRLHTEFIDVRGLRLAVHHWGAHDAPTLLLLHGFLDAGLSFRAIAEQLADRYHVLAPDFRGFGHSGWVGSGGYYHFYDYWSDMAALTRELLPGPFHLVGHSMGGSVATGMVALGIGDVRSLLLLEGLGPPWDEPGRSLARLRRWVDTLAAVAISGSAAERARHMRPMSSIAAAADRLCERNPRLGRVPALRLAEDLTRSLPATERGSEDGRVWRHDPLHLTPAAKPFLPSEAQSLWRAVRVPTLVLYGTDSDHVALDLSQRALHLPHATLAAVPGAGHNMHHERPELMAAIIHRHASGLDGLHEELLAGLPAPSEADAGG